MSPYSPVSNRPNFNQIEQEVIAFWKEAQIFTKTITKNLEQEEFVFFEGPPTANGLPGVHHVLARTFKDLVCRYQTMQGKLVRRRAGWDEHGLPVEIEVQKEHQLHSKEDIEKLGIAEFNRLCAASTQKYIGEWEALTERMAYWVDFQEAYRTSSPQYIDRVWAVLQHLHQKGLLYQGYKVVPWACDSGTVVSQAEVALGYQPVIDESAYVKFTVPAAESGALRQKYQIPSEANLALVAWTTTPWTLPSNMALAVGAPIRYALCKHRHCNEYLILSTKRRVAVLGEENWITVAELSAHELLFKGYQHPLAVEGACLGVHLADFVEDDEGIGSGVVHIAPAFGQDDHKLYQALQQAQSDLPAIINLVSPDGRFTEEAPDFLRGESLFNRNKSGISEFKRINNIILKHLEERNALLLREKYEHSYPHNWRTGNPLIYYLRPSWYIATQSLRQRLLRANATIQWFPEHIQSGRFGNWLENNVDWAISRERYWGTPLPIWVGQTSGQLRVIGSLRELEERCGREITDPHKHIVDRITWQEEGEHFVRVSEVLDCWFDSGAMPTASFGRAPQDFLAADYICEAIDQTRGWFYSLLAIAVACSSEEAPRSPYKKVLCLGHLLDKDGQKMSKTRGNAIDPWELFERFGVDALRWYLIASCTPGNPLRFDPEGVAEVVKRFLLQLWNTYAFYVLYANLDQVEANTLGNEPPPELQVIDRWLIARVKSSFVQVSRAYDSYEFSKATQLIEKLTDDLSNVWVRANRYRFWNASSSEVDRAAYYTLNFALLSICTMATPFTPLLTEQIYRNLRLPKMPESIHLKSWDLKPFLQNLAINADEESYLEQMNDTMEVLNVGRKLRQEANLKIRQPLSRIRIPRIYHTESFQELIRNELNIKEVEMTDEITEIALETELNEALQVEGMAREFIHAIQGFRKKCGLEVADRIRLLLPKEPEQLLKQLEQQREYIMRETLAVEWSPLGSASAELKQPIRHSKDLKLAGHHFSFAIERV